MKKLSFFLLNLFLVIFQSTFGMQQGAPQSALTQAVQRDDFPAVITILSSLTPEQIAQDFALSSAKSISMAGLLMNRSIGTPSNLLYACSQKNNEELIHFYLEHGVDPNFQRAKTKDESFFHHCAHDPSKLTLVPLLLQAGAQINKQTNSGETIFHYAARAGNNKFCNTVIDRFLKAHHRFIQFLVYLKKEYPHFYAVKPMVKLCFQKYAPLPILKQALALQSTNHKRACDLKSSLRVVDILKPENCSYSVLKQLRSRYFEIVAAPYSDTSSKDEIKRRSEMAMQRYSEEDARRHHAIFSNGPSL